MYVSNAMCTHVYVQHVSPIIAVAWLAMCIAHIHVVGRAIDSSPSPAIVRITYTCIYNTHVWLVAYYLDVIIIATHVRTYTLHTHTRTHISCDVAYAAEMYNVLRSQCAR